jgi:hypothetical protein
MQKALGFASRRRPMSRGSSAIALSVLVLFAIPAYATDPSGIDESLTHKLMNYWNEIDGYIHPAPQYCPSKPVVPVLKGSPQCVSRYQKLFSKPDIDITMAFGYTDWRPESLVTTSYEVGDFNQKMTQPCVPATFQGAAYKMFCGFSRDSDDATLFYKQIPGPDGKDHRVRIHVVAALDFNSSQSESDDQLRNTPEQLARSAEARKEFIKALQQDDVVLYNGHARDGGGPDFSPPVLTAAKHPDYAWYHRNHPGLNDMLTALSSSKHHPQVIGLMACDSKLHFEKKLSQVTPESALLLTNMTSYTEDESKTEAAFLDGLLSMRCDDDFVNSMETSLPLVDGHPELGSAPVDDFEGWGVKTPNVTPAPARNIY